MARSVLKRDALPRRQISELRPYRRGISGRLPLGTERKRLWDTQRQKEIGKPRTEMGKRLQGSTAASTALVDRWVEEMADNILEETDEEGPPN